MPAWCWRWRRSPSPLPPAPQTGPTRGALFAASLRDTDGKAYALSRLRGRPPVVNFWARWCGPCRVEIPQLAQAERRLRDRGLIVVGIGIEDQADTVREFARAAGTDAPTLLPESACYPFTDFDPMTMVRMEARYRMRGDGLIEQTLRQFTDNNPRGEDIAWAKSMFRELLAYQG